MLTALAPSPALPVDPDPRGLGCGCLVALVQGVERPLPLRLTRARARLAGDCARVEVEQVFENPFDQPLEVVHLFPLPPDGAVIEAELRAGETQVRAALRERKEATAVFEQARAAGQRAMLLTAERADVHTLRVTNLPPRTEARVRIVVVERLASEDGAYRWRFPTVIAPRYMPGQAVGHSGPGVAPDTDRVPDASRLQPPLRLAGGSLLDLEVEVAGPVRRIASSLHAVSLDLDEGAVRVAPAEQATLNRDFVLSFSTAAPEAATARAWTDGRHSLVILEPPLSGGSPLPRDAVFVVDISGSMSGAKMDAAKRALKAALHGLLEGDRFLLLAFDDRLELFAREFTAYDERSLAKADQWVDRLRARGGTEMLPALKTALAGDTPAGRLRTVLFITDGQAGNDAELVAAVANRKGAGRLFTLGIDTAVNEALLSRLARVGGGTATLCTPRDDIEAVVARIEARFGAPLLAGLRVEGGGEARPEAMDLFQGKPAAALLEGAPAEICLKSEGGQRFCATPQRLDFPLGALWARERVAWLEDRLALRPFEEEAIVPEIGRVALAGGVASRFTAFVAVDTRTTTDGTRREIVMPVELPAQWEAPQDAGATTTAFFAIPAPRRVSATMAPPPAPMAPPPAPGGAPPPMMMDRMIQESDDEAPKGRDGLLQRAKSFLAGRAAPASAPAPVSASVAAPRAKKAEVAATADPSAGLAASQGADGSFDGDPRRTAAALLCLVLLGHTRRAGLRRRVVLKAATWLAKRGEPEARLAMAALEAAERGEAVTADAAWKTLASAGEEGAALGRLAGW